MSRVLNLLLTHQSATAVARMLAWWRDLLPAGRRARGRLQRRARRSFAQIDHPQKVRVSDPRLSTRDHQRERQSYGAVWRGTSQWLAEHVGAISPTSTSPNTTTCRSSPGSTPCKSPGWRPNAPTCSASSSPAWTARTSRTYLYHLPQPGFMEHWASISVRREPGVVLSMFGSGSFWTREAFDAVARVDEPLPIYLEISLSTTAHHLGYRLRDWGEQNRARPQPGQFRGPSSNQARRDGAWTLHPVKTLWNRPAMNIYSIYQPGLALRFRPAAHGGFIAPFPAGERRARARRGRVPAILAGYAISARTSRRSTSNRVEVPEAMRDRCEADDRRRHAAAVRQRGIRPRVFQQRHRTSRQPGKPGTLCAGNRTPGRPAVLSCRRRRANSPSSRICSRRFFHWLPRGVQRRVARYGTGWGLLTKPRPGQQVEDLLQEIRLLNVREFQSLFPDGLILKEKFLGLTKSYSAVDRG